MASALEALPTELLDVITENLNHAGVAALLQCSKHLHQCLEPSFYGAKNVRDEAMYSACKKGNKETIHLTLSYGADVSVIKWGPVPPGFEEAASKFDMRTLQLAARKWNLETFSLLLNFGAKMDMGQPKELNYLIRRLSSPGNETLLHTFLKSEPSRQIDRRCRRNSPLISMILRRAPLEFVKMLLNEGADPDQFARHKAARIPLTAAIMTNSPPIFALLIQYGAKVNVEYKMDYDNRGSSHVPVFAAALAMAKQGDITFMQRCLDAGADINNNIYFDWNFPAEGYRFGWITTDRRSTPILCYLNAISSWAPSSTSLRSADGVKYLLDRGAETNVPLVAGHSPKFQKNKFSAVEIMLVKWTLKQLIDPEFFALMKILVENGSGKTRIVHILIQATKINCSDPTKESSPEILASWREFVQLLLRHRDKEHDTADSLLKRLLFDHRQQKPPYSTLRDLDRCTVECLVEAGAKLKEDKLELLIEKGRRSIWLPVPSLA